MKTQKIRDILDSKGHFVATIAEDQSVYDAMAKLEKERIGSLLVVDTKEEILGIIGLPDCNRAALASCDMLGKTKVTEIMTKDVICAFQDDTIEKASKLMTKNRVRHLPIVEDGKLCGIISIGDVVKAQLETRDIENQYLREYIQGPQAFE